MNSETAPINKLPDELLANIFIQKLFDDTDQSTDNTPVFLTHICRRWHDIAVSTSLLWTIIRIKTGMPNPESRVRYSLERSGTLPIIVSIELLFQEKYEDWQESSESDLRLAFSLIGTNWHRYESVTIMFETQYLADAYMCDILWPANAECAEAPQLHSLAIASHGKFLSLPEILIHSPRLSRFYAENLDPIRTLYSLNSLRVMKLSAHFYPLELGNQYVEFLSKLTHLEEFYIECDIEGSLILPQGPFSGVILPSLKRLHVRWRALWTERPEHWISVIRAPRMESFSLKYDYGSHTPDYASLCEAWNDNLLALRELELSGVDLNTAGFVDFLRYTPNVTCLSLSGKSVAAALQQLTPGPDIPPDEYLCPRLRKISTFDAYGADRAFLDFVKRRMPAYPSAPSMTTFANLEYVFVGGFKGWSDESIDEWLVLGENWKRGKSALEVEWDRECRYYEPDSFSDDEDEFEDVDYEDAMSSSYFRQVNDFRYSVLDRWS